MIEMDKDMLEESARALYQSARHGTGLSGTWEHAEYKDKQSYRRHVAAVLGVVKKRLDANDAAG